MSELHKASYAYGARQTANATAASANGGLANVFMACVILGGLAYGAATVSGALRNEGAEAVRNQVHADAMTTNRLMAPYEQAMAQALAPEPKKATGGKKLPKNATSGIKIHGGSK